MVKIKREWIQGILEDLDAGRGIVDKEVMANTAERVARMYNTELFVGYKTDPQSLLKRTFSSDYSEMVIVSNITFSSLCEHHMLPFRGVAHIGYIPAGRILGLSKFARLVDCLSKRLQLQERLVSQIADSLMEGIRPHGVAVVTEAEHECMSIRGVNKPGSKTTVSAMRGMFKEDAKTREEFLRLIRKNAVN